MFYPIRTKKPQNTLRNLCQSTKYWSTICIIFATSHIHIKRRLWRMQHRNSISYSHIHRMFMQMISNTNPRIRSWKFQREIICTDRNRKKNDSDYFLLISFPFTPNTINVDIQRNECKKYCILVNPICPQQHIHRSSTWQTRI